MGCSISKFIGYGDTVEEAIDMLIIDMGVNKCISIDYHKLETEKNGTIHCIHFRYKGKRYETFISLKLYKNKWYAFVCK